MRENFAMPREEFLFGLLMASVHAGQHLFLRLFPPLIPILVLDFEATLWQLGLLVTVYMFAGGIFQAPMGILSDRYDRQFLLVPAFLAMGFGYLVFVFAPILGPTLPTLMLGGQLFEGPYLIMALGMFAAGVGYSAVHPVGYPLISANVAADNKGKVLGMWGSASKIGDALAPFLVGVFIIVVSWEWILVGISLAGFVFAAFLYVTFRGGRYETKPPATDATSTDRASAISLRRHPRRFLYPMVAVVLSFFFILFASNGLMTYTPVFITDVYGYSISLGWIEIEPASVANFYFGILLISGAISQLVIGGITDIYDHRIVLITLLVLGSIGLVILSLMPVGPILLLLVFIGLGITLFGVNPARDALISDITPAAYEGRTFGYIWTFALVGSSIYPVLIGYLADLRGLRVAFSVLAIGAIGGAICIGMLYSRKVYQRQPESGDR